MFYHYSIVLSIPARREFSHYSSTFCLYTDFRIRLGILYSIQRLHFYWYIFGNEIQRDSSEIAKIETSYNNYSKILLMKEFGIWNYSKMAGGINKGLNTGIDFCIKIIGSDKVKSNQMLRYHILIKLYKAYLINGQYAEAQEQLILALEIEPKDILTNFWLSETYEYLDRADSAIKSYEELLNIKDIEPNLKDHILEQIDRVHTKGPRLPAKVPGLKYMSY